MGKTTIEWTSSRRADGSVVPGYTFNPWHGCLKVSPGCEHCYAETLSRRWGRDIWGPAKTTHRMLMSASYWKQPFAWNAAAEAAHERRFVFCASMADLFEAHPDVYTERLRVFEIIRQTPALDWLLLTKRPENIMPFVPVSWQTDWPFNAWIGTSVEDQQRAELRIPILVDVPAPVHFLSCEPLLGPIDLRPWLWESAGPEWAGFNPSPDIDWIIAGGESGPGARPMHPEWARSLRDQAVESGAAFFFKQWGEYLPDGQGAAQLDEQQCFYRELSLGGQKVYRVGKKAAGRLLDDREWSEFPGAYYAETRG